MSWPQAGSLNSPHNHVENSHQAVLAVLHGKLNLVLKKLVDTQIQAVYMNGPLG